MLDSNALQERERLEAEYFDNYEKRSRGIPEVPSWFDYTRAQYIPYPRQYFNYEAATYFDPMTLRTLLGTKIRKMLSYSASGGKKILELGCGSGWLALELARRGNQVTAVDISSGRIDAAREYFESRKLVERISGDIFYRAESLNDAVFDAEAFDLVFAHASLHHIESLGELLGRVSYALKPGGRLIVLDHFGFDARAEKCMAFFDHFFNTPFARSLKRVEKPVPEAGPQLETVSPCEDIHTQDILQLITRWFDVRETDFFSPVSFQIVERFFQIYNWKTWAKIPALIFLKFFDCYLERFEKIRGELLFLVAEKKPCKHDKNKGSR